MIRCPGCDSRVENQSTNRILKLVLPKDLKTYTLQNLIDYNVGNFKNTDEHVCEKCFTKMLKKTDIKIYNKILIIQLLLFSEEMGDCRIVKAFKIKGIPQEKLKICNKKFKVVGAIFHEGPSIKHGIFYALLRKDKQ